MRERLKVLQRKLDRACAFQNWSDLSMVISEMLALLEIALPIDKSDDI